MEIQRKYRKLDVCCRGFLKEFFWVIFKEKYKIRKCLRVNIICCFIVILGISFIFRIFFYNLNFVFLIEDKIFQVMMIVIVNGIEFFFRLSVF